MILSSIKTLNIKQQRGNDKTALTSCSKYAIASAHTSWHECWFIITCIRKQALRYTEGHLLFTLASSFCLCKETSLFPSLHTEYQCWPATTDKLSLLCQPLWKSAVYIGLFLTRVDKVLFVLYEICFSIFVCVCRMPHLSLVCFSPLL